MTSSRPSAAAAAAAAAPSSAATITSSMRSASARRLTRASHSSPSSSAFARAGSHVSPPASSSASFRSSPPRKVPRLLAANLATLATAATASRASCTHQQSHSHPSHGPYHHHHHSHHHSPYHPYQKPTAASILVSTGSSDETDDDDTLFLLPARQPPPPQYHPQHHHRLITGRASSSSSSNSKMPRRKETKKIQLGVPSSEASRGIEGDPHQVFKCNGSPIISPRSIRNSLAETDFDVDGNPRPMKVANTDATSSSSSNSVALGPVRPPPSASAIAARLGALSPATVGANSKKKLRRRRIGDGDGDGSAGSATPASRPGTPNGTNASDVDVLALKVAEQSLAGMSGIQLWVHRLLYTHHQTLHVLGLERGAFPNTRLSLKQLETMLAPVTALADLMTPEHFGIHVPTPQIAATMNDVHYWKLWESDTIDIGIFFMPPNSHIPLHNHPGMSVVTRILYGSVNIRSYDLVSADDVPDGDSTTVNGKDTTDIVGTDPKVMWARVSREGPYAAESTMWLDPRRFNLHQIHAASANGCAMLDIMIPPYNNADRDCHHYKILEEKYNQEKNERIVKMIESISTGNHNEPTASSRDAPESATSASVSASS